MPAVVRNVGRTCTGRQSFEGCHWRRCWLMEIRNGMGRSKARQAVNRLEVIMTKDMDVETVAQIAVVAHARDLMASKLGQMPYESEFGKLTLEAVWGPTALQGLDGEQNVGIATTNGAIRLLNASYKYDISLD